MIKVKTLTVKSPQEEQKVRYMDTTLVKDLKNEVLSRYRLTAAERRFYRVLLDGAMLQESKTLAELGIPDEATLTLILTSATDI